MTRDRAAQRVRKLLALAANGSGAAPEEARNAALAAANLIVAHGLLDGSGPKPAIDLDQVAAVSVRCLELEHRLDEERRLHATEIKNLNAAWHDVVETVRCDERRAAHAERRTATKKAVLDERQAQARAGGRARDRKLSGEKKREIAKAAAAARWARWRKRRQVQATKSNG